MSNEDSLTSTPLKDNIKYNHLQKNKSVEKLSALDITNKQTPDMRDSSVPNKTDKIKTFLPEIRYNNTVVSSNVIDDTNMSLSSHSTPTVIEETPKNIFDTCENIKLDDSSELNLNDDLLGSPKGLDRSEMLKPGLKETDVIPKLKTDNILHNLDDDTLKSSNLDKKIKPYPLPKNKLIKELNPVENTDLQMIDLIDGTTQNKLNLIVNHNKTTMTELPINVINKHSSDLDAIHNYNDIDKVEEMNVNHDYISNFIVDHNSNSLFSSEDGNPYGLMLPHFSTKYVGGDDSSYNLWETIPPKINYDLSKHKENDNFNNGSNQFTGDTLKDNYVSNDINNEKKILTNTETVINGNVNSNIHNKQYDDFIKKMSEQLFKKIDNIDDKLSKLDKLSNNRSSLRESENIRSHDPSINKVLLMNDVPITKSEIPIRIEEPDSKTNKPSESLEVKISSKTDDENEIRESTKAKKHKDKKRKKHTRHGRHNKKKGNNKKNISDDNDDVDDDDEKSKNINDSDDGEFINNKRPKKNKRNHNDDDGHKKKHYKKKYSKGDKDDDVGSHRKNKSHKKIGINDEDVEILQNNKTDIKKMKKIKGNTYSPKESNEVNNSSSIQINSEDNDSKKKLKIKSSKSKNSQNTNLTKKKNPSPKKKSKYIKHSKTKNYKNNEIPVDVSDEDTSSNEYNYNSENTYVKYNDYDTQNNVLKDKNHKHKRHNKHLKTKNIYKYKKIPVDDEDESSDENNVNLEETYNINITGDNALKPKRLKHKKIKKEKTIDINIVKDSDTQVLNNNITKNGYQLYTFYPQYRYVNPFLRFLY
ncbi:uncharacterized protein MAL13P1.304-like [Melanaphis sacchari]|uniref:uncharacterized protein MAL13P1.304-like n=1 Tax=Melanaphis sacchari TaxID=742174 RepID=UPI000DC14200|nr:uncharacterized protein MAL13P1.304-like [Melanaphis sacchari]